MRQKCFAIKKHPWIPERTTATDEAGMCTARASANPAHSSLCVVRLEEVSMPPSGPRKDFGKGEFFKACSPGLWAEMKQAQRGCTVSETLALLYASWHHPLMQARVTLNCRFDHLERVAKKLGSKRLPQQLGASSQATSDIWQPFLFAR